MTDATKAREALTLAASALDPRASNIAEIRKAVNEALALPQSAGEAITDEQIAIGDLNRDWNKLIIALTEIANRASNLADDDAVEWMPSIYMIACEAIGEDPHKLLKATGFDGNIANWPTPAPPSPALDPVTSRCFHCSEVITDKEAAREHFGFITLLKPGCIDPMRGDEKALRRREIESERLFRKVCAERDKLFSELKEAYAKLASPAPSREPTVPQRIVTANLQEAWAALALIRETVETLGPVGAMKASEHLDGPTFTHEAQAIVEGIRTIAAPSNASEAVPVAWTNEAQLGHLKTHPGVPMAMWEKRGDKADVPLYAAPASNAKEE